MKSILINRSINQQGMYIITLLEYSKGAKNTAGIIDRAVYLTKHANLLDANSEALALANQLGADWIIFSNGKERKLS